MYPNSTEPTTPTATATAAQTADAWEEIFHNPDHSAQTWTCIAAAVDHADATLRHAARTATDSSDPELRRGGALWRQAAAASYQMLHDTGAYRHLDADPPAHAVADPIAAQAWLNAPAATGPEATTVADTLNVDEDFLLDDENRPARIARLLAEAQRVGVLRSDSAQIQLWHIADDHGDLDGHRIAVCRDDGVVLASTHLSIDDLADDTLTGIEAATTVLTQTAVIVNDIITVAARADALPSPSAPPTYPTYAEPDLDTTPPPVPAWVQGFRPRGGRGFPPPGPGNASSPPSPRVPSPPRPGHPLQDPAAVVPAPGTPTTGAGPASAAPAAPQPPRRHR